MSKKADIEYNLAKCNPTLANEWHPTKNGDLKPEDVTPGSTLNVWWLFRYYDSKSSKWFDFEWQAPVYSRNSGNGCPFVSGKKVWPGFNDLATLYPNIAVEWHPTKNGNLRPCDVLAKSPKKAWWFLPYDDPIQAKHFDFEWEAVIESRVDGSSCPFLSGQAVWPGFNDLQTTNPQLAAEWHPEKNGEIKPKDITAGSKYKAWWQYSYDDPITQKHFDFEWQAAVYSRTSIKSSNCPFLSGKAVWSGFNDLATRFPNLAKQWHPTKNGQLMPSEVAAQSNSKVWWFFPYDDPNTGKHFDFEWEAEICNRVIDEGCPYISGRRVWAGYNDLATVRPDIANEWNYEKNTSLLPSQVSASARELVWWIYRYDDPRTGKHFDFEWQAYVYSRTSKHGANCPFTATSNAKLWSGYNDVKTVYPNILVDWDYEKNKTLPQHVLANSPQKVWWLCDKGHSYRMTIQHHVDGEGCPTCSKSRKISFPEYVILHFVNQIPNITAIPQYSPSYLGHRSLDIFIPQINLGIEYDGGWYHDDSDRDSRKTEILEKHGIHLLRIREDSCPEINDGSTIITVPHNFYNGKLMNFSSIVEQINDILRSRYNVFLPSNLDIRVDYNALKQEYEDFLANFYSKK